MQVFKTLKKLDGIEMSIEILQKTKVGKFINGLKKKEAYKKQSQELVRKWKLMVQQHEKEEVQPQNNVKSEYDPNGNWSTDKLSNQKKKKKPVENEVEYIPGETNVTGYTPAGHEATYNPIKSEPFTEKYEPYRAYNPVKIEPNTEGYEPASHKSSSEIYNPVKLEPITNGYEPALREVSSEKYSSVKLEHNTNGYEPASQEASSEAYNLVKLEPNTDEYEPASRNTSFEEYNSVKLKPKTNRFELNSRKPMSAAYNPVKKEPNADEYEQTSRDLPVHEYNPIKQEPDSHEYDEASCESTFGEYHPEENSPIIKEYQPAGGSLSTSEYNPMKLEPGSNEYDPVKRDKYLHKSKKTKTKKSSAVGVDSDKHYGSSISSDTTAHGYVPSNSGYIPSGANFLDSNYIPSVKKIKDEYCPSGGSSGDYTQNLSGGSSSKKIKKRSRKDKANRDQHLDLKANKDGTTEYHPGGENNALGYTPTENIKEKRSSNGKTPRKHLSAKSIKQEKNNIKLEEYCPNSHRNEEYSPSKSSVEYTPIESEYLPSNGGSSSTNSSKCSPTSTKAEEKSKRTEESPSKVRRESSLTRCSNLERKQTEKSGLYIWYLSVLKRFAKLI